MNRNEIHIIPSNRVRQLAKKAIAKEACSACCVSLIHALQRLSDNDRPIYLDNNQGFLQICLSHSGCLKCLTDNLLCFFLNLFKMVFSLKAFRINLIDIFRTGRTGGKPAVRRANF
ncbi:Hypothetical protein LUCI_2720 [Lucifera butyrica]|uniref:Uncharacterized protein n=1 Tax=Lucifera butyrica TaxID=1351585 RepID=A0A498R7V4_9FIRM|nr:Hypothetical protein LUCI_2720 [Lucifera butyrica]